ncbi:MAG: GntR family transcriptional regulator [Aeromicrobium sp.]|nr:GntR family transcriptional regulator [Aeromicrobium sp.]
MTDKKLAEPQQVGQRLHMPKMAELIGADLRRQIVRGELREGDSLPSEGVLMEQFGVSRPTLREAFRVLESESLISIRRGARGGARVHIPDGSVAARYAGLVLEHRGTTLRDVYDCRSHLESSCAGMAATARTDEDIASLKVTLREIEETRADLPRRMDLHAQFHAQVVEAARNQTMLVLSSMLRTIIDRSTIESIVATAHLSSTDDAYHEAHKAHWRLIKLIEQRDADEAAAHWRRHLDLAEEFVLSTGVAAHSVLDLL